MALSQEVFDGLSRDDLEKLKFVLTGSGEVAIRVYIAGGGLSVNWGGIGGTLTDQADLTAALNGKQAAETAILQFDRTVFVRAASTANLTLSGTPTVDGVALLAGDLFLAKNQTTASQNGVYVVAAGAWTRATDYSTTLNLNTRDIYVSNGTTLAGTWWSCYTRNPTVGTTSLVFGQVPTTIGTAANQAAAGNHTHASLALTAASSIGAALSERYTSRTATATTASTDLVVRFSGSTAAQVETMPVAAALSNNSGRIVRYVNAATVSWTLRQSSSNTVDGSASDITLAAGEWIMFQATAANAWTIIARGIRSAIAIGAGDMLKSTYDAASIMQQVVGTTAAQTVSNKTLVSVESITLNIAPGSIPTAEGAMYWDATDHTLALVTDISGVILQVGQEMFIRARNATGSTITNGQAVYVNGATGNRPTIALARADADATARGLIGVATADIANNADSYVTILGNVRGLNTSGFSNGATLYLSETTAGALTSTRPTAPNYAVKVGVVTLSHLTNGIILVNPQYQSVNKADIIGGIGVDGSGAAGQVPYWTSASAIGGEADFRYNSAVNILYIGTEAAADSGTIMLGGSGAGVGTVTTAGGKLALTGGGVDVTANGLTDIVFKTNSVERARLNASGLTVAGLSGMVKAATGVLQNAVAGTDYVAPSGGTFSGAVNLGYSTASRALATDSSKNIVASAVTITELEYLSGVTSPVQDQINALGGASGYEFERVYPGNPVITGPFAYATARAATTLSQVSVNAKQLPAGAQSFTTAGTTDFPVGNAAANTRIAMTFVASAAYLVTSLACRAKKVGSPTALRVSIYATSSNLPTTSSAACVVDLPAANASTSYAAFAHRLAGLQLTSGTTYAIVFEATGGVDASNYWVIEGISTGGAAGSQVCIYNGSTWSASGTNKLRYSINGADIFDCRKRADDTVMTASDSITSGFGFATTELDASKLVKYTAGFTTAVAADDRTEWHVLAAATVTSLGTEISVKNA